MRCDPNVRLHCTSHWLPPPVAPTLTLRLRRTPKRWWEGGPGSRLDSVAAGKGVFPRHLWELVLQVRPRERPAYFQMLPCRLSVCSVLGLSLLSPLSVHVAHHEPERRAREKKKQGDATSVIATVPCSPILPSERRSVTQSRPARLENGGLASLSWKLTGQQRYLKDTAIRLRNKPHSDHLLAPCDHVGRAHCARRLPGWKWSVSLADGLFWCHRPSEQA